MLKVPAEFGQPPARRGAAEALGVLGGFSADEVTDAVLAGDGVCSQLIIGAAENAQLSAVFTVAGSKLVATLSAQVAHSYSFPQSGFGWQVLTAVADAITVFDPASGPGAGQREVAVDLVKRGSGH